MESVVLPQLERTSSGDIAFWTDRALSERAGILVAFSERSGGVSVSPFETLNVAAHVGDDPNAVDQNRTRLLDALGVSEFRSELVTAEQIHGTGLAVVGREDAGAGSFATTGKKPLPRTDAILTREHGIPLMLCFADCVPVVLVAPNGGIAIAHAGWRGAFACLPGTVATALSEYSGCSAGELSIYIGPHINSCHYGVNDLLMSQFVRKFGTLARAESGGLDLDAVVTASLDRAGVIPCNIARLGICTAEATDSFYSHRAEQGRSGRHAAVACVL